MTYTEKDYEADAAELIGVCKGFVDTKGILSPEERAELMDKFLPPLVERLANHIVSHGLDGDTVNVRRMTQEEYDAEKKKAQM